ncbi:alpha/beta hydrolase fold-domain-containing protein [Absidia repens]|uniref:Alpha/beta hydrolase fold-domain-containing protein n=1 Tax=Absidia repens TaxID=90262 RepID=A0A1X2J311_9FUNG|nr:alpha/beta hydrolase fold-domain-containing protein [Absidia repens]
MTINQYPCHPVYQATFEAMNKLGFRLSSPDYVQTRHIVDTKPLPEGVVLPESIVEEKVITAGLDNQSVTLTIVRPAGTENEVLPGLVYFHGGGYVLGSYHGSEKLLKDLAKSVHTAVIFVDYSLSPEVKFPVAVEECYSSVLWLHENAASLKVDPSKLAVAGDSAGGNLSTVTSILLKQRNHSDILKGQVLLYPVVAQSSVDYESYKVYGDGDYFLSRDDMAFFFNAYLDGQEVPKDVRVAPLLATLDELKDLPPALVLTAECDVLRDEGEEYARRLTDAGVDACCIRTIGAIHGYLTMPLDTPQYRRSISLITDFLKNDVFGI